MKKIEGVFSGKTLKEYPICVDTYGTLGFKYATYRDEHIKLLLKEVPDFEMVFSIFINKSIFGFKSRKILDICLSLFYNPYFNEFYGKIKEYSKHMGITKRNYLIKHMLKYLSDDIHYEIIVNRNMIDNSLREYYIEKDIYAKSKELLDLLQK